MQVQIFSNNLYEMWNSQIDVLCLIIYYVNQK